MKRLLGPVAAGLMAFSVTAATAGPTTGEFLDQPSVDKDCVASVFSYATDETVPLRGQARFDHFKKRTVEPAEADRPFINFVAIGSKHKTDVDPQALPQCGSSAGLP